MSSHTSKQNKKHQNNQTKKQTTHVELFHVIVKQSVKHRKTQNAKYYNKNRPASSLLQLQLSSEL
jgi:hypothetical protein